MLIKMIRLFVNLHLQPRSVKSQNQTHGDSGNASKVTIAGQQLNWIKMPRAPRQLPKELGLTISRRIGVDNFQKN